MQLIPLFQAFFDKTNSCLMRRTTCLAALRLLADLLNGQVRSCCGIRILFCLHSCAVVWEQTRSHCHLYNPLSLTTGHMALQNSTTPYLSNSSPNSKSNIEPLLSLYITFLFLKLMDDLLVLTRAVFVMTVLLPLDPHRVTTHLPDLYEAFTHVATLKSNKQMGMIISHYFFVTIFLHYHREHSSWIVSCTRCSCVLPIPATVLTVSLWFCTVSERSIWTNRRSGTVPRTHCCEPKTCLLKIFANNYLYSDLNRVQILWCPFSFSRTAPVFSCPAAS